VLGSSAPLLESQPFKALRGLYHRLSLSQLLEALYNHKMKVI
jgi:hypothetical protein